MEYITYLFLTVSTQFNLPNNLLSSLCYVESKHEINAIHLDDGGSKSLGICQVKYNTAKWLGFKGTESELMLPENNIYYAAKYLAYQQKRYSCINKAIIAYNKGNAKHFTKSKYRDKVIKQWRGVNYER